MKKIITLSAFTLACFSLQAQITIQHSDYSTWTPGVDTFADITQFTAVPGINVTHDLTTAVYDDDFTRTRITATNTNLPGATYMEEVYYSFSSFTYLSDMYLGNTTQGIQRFGEVIERQAYSLANLTMNTADSLVFVDQVVVYTAPRTMLKFPATYGTNWSSDFKFNTNFELTVTMYGLNQTPGSRNSHTVQTDSVIGWGKMMVNNIDGDASGLMDVLAVKTKASIADSFFLNGSPAPAPLLTAFSLTQGMVTNSYRMSYYRAGETDPLLYIQYTDSTYTTPSMATVHMSRLAEPTNVNHISSNNVITVFPNPVTDGTINVAIVSGRSSKWSYELVNAMGQQVANNTLQSSNGIATIPVGNQVPGMYYLRVYENGQAAFTTPVVLQSK